MPKQSAEAANTHQAAPGAVIGDILEDIGVSLRAAAAAMGVSHNALANVVRGDAGVSIIPWATSVERRCEIDASRRTPFQPTPCGVIVLCTAHSTCLEGDYGANRRALF